MLFASATTATAVTSIGSPRKVRSLPARLTNSTFNVLSTFHNYRKDFPQVPDVFRDKLTEENELGSGRCCTTYGVGDLVVQIRTEGHPLCKEGDINRDLRILRRLNCGHPRIAHFEGLCGENLVFKRYRSDLHNHLKKTGRPTSVDALKWSIQITQGLCFVHSRGILHADTSCVNVLIDNDLNAVLADFGGSVIDKCKARTCYNCTTSNPAWLSEVSMRTELFALGCTLYQVWSACTPHSTTSRGVPSTRFYVEGRFRKRQWPKDVHEYAIGELLVKCFESKYKTVLEVLDDLMRVEVDEPIAERLRLELVMFEEMEKTRRQKSVDQKRGLLGQVRWKCCCVRERIREKDSEAAQRPDQSRP